MAGETDRENLFVYSREWYHKNDITLITNKMINNVDFKNCQVGLSDETKVSYDKLIIALGAHPFKPSILGNDLENVITVRTIEDADYIIDKMNSVNSCVCIGGGILGLEVAGAIAKLELK